MRPRLISQTDIARFFFALNSRIEPKSTSARIEPQKIETLFAAKLGAKHESVGTRISSKPMRIEIAGRGQPKYFAWCFRIERSSTTTACNWPVGISQ